MEKKAKINKIEIQVKKIRAMYEEMLNETTTGKRRAQIVEEFMKFHKLDGSFSVIEDPNGGIDEEEEDELESYGIDRF